MAPNLAILRSQVEATLAGRIPAPFTYRDRNLVETVSAGISEVDSLTGGLPRGCPTKIFGPPCSGRTTLLFSALACRTAEDEVCALVDGYDAFDPHAAAAAGVKLTQLLWVRCRSIDQALRVTDLLLQGKGFGLIAVDLSDLPPQTVRHIPLNAWFRMRRAVEDTPTALLLLEQQSNAKTCASLVLRMRGDQARWSATLETHPRNLFWHPLARLFNGFSVCAEVRDSRIRPVSGAPIRNFSAATKPAGNAENFANHTKWGYLSGR